MIASEIFRDRRISEEIEGIEGNQMKSKQIKRNRMKPKERNQRKSKEIEGNRGIHMKSEEIAGNRRK